MKSKLIPIVDIDSVVYRCGFASDSNKDAEGNVIQEPLSYCLNSVKGSVAAIMDVFEPSEKARIFLQGGGNYRDRVATIQPYKGNRDPANRPTWYHEIREYLQEFWGAELVTGMETDDACGIEQWKHKDRSTCIVSIDKDLKCIPGNHYNFVTGEMCYVTLAEANRNFWKQVLTGDDTDNILGCGVKVEGRYKTGKKAGQLRIRREGVGPMEADSILQKTDGSWLAMANAVAREYEKRNMFWPVFHENATLLWIQREHMINYNGEPINVNDGSIEYNDGASATAESEKSS